MATSKTKRAKAAIDEAQAALQQAEDALGVKTPAEVTAVAEQTYEAIVTYDAQDAAGDAPIEAATDAQAEAPAPNSAPATQPDGEAVAFTVAEALTYLGIDAQFASSHAIHRTVIGVLFNADGSAHVGAFVEERPEHFNRHEACMLAISSAAKSEPVKPAYGRKLIRG